MLRWTSLIVRFVLSLLLSRVHALPHTNIHIHTQTRTSTHKHAHPQTLPLLSSPRFVLTQRPKKNGSLYRTRWRKIAMCASRKGSHSTNQDLIWFLNGENNVISQNCCISLIRLFVWQVKRDLHVCKRDLPLDKRDSNIVQRDPPTGQNKVDECKKDLLIRQKRLRCMPKRPTCTYQTEVFKRDLPTRQKKPTHQTQMYAKKTYVYPKTKETQIYAKETYPQSKETQVFAKRFRCVQKKPTCTDQTKETQMYSKEMYRGDKRDHFTRQKWVRCMQKRHTV